MTSHTLHLETGRHLYGGAWQVLFLLEGLRRHGSRVTLVCPHGSRIGATASSRGLPVRPAPMRGALDPLFVLRLVRLIGALQPDLLHVHSRRGADLWGAVAAAWTGVPAVVTRRVDNPERPWLARVKYRRYRKVVSISEEIARVLQSEGVRADRIACVPSAIDAARFQHPCDPQWFGRQFGIAVGTRCIGVVAQLIPRKGHRYLLAAAPALLARHPDLRILFFGQGQLAEALRQQCRELQIDKQVIFAGFREDLDRILPCLDLVVHPATMEGLGVALLEAAAAGIPIVASRVGGIPEVVHHRCNGLLIPPAAPDELAAAITALLNDPQTAATMGTAGQDLVRTRFSVEAMVAGNLAVYRQVLAGKH